MDSKSQGEGGLTGDRSAPVLFQCQVVSVVLVDFTQQAANRRCQQL